MTDSKALARARELLADTESQIANGLGGPYAEKNLATHRARVARLEAAQAPATPAPVAHVAPAAPKAPAAPIITGTREERLRRLATAMGADDEALAAAISNGTSPDAFAVEIAESRDPEAVARRIANSDRPAARKAAPEVEEIAARIAAA